MAVGLLIFAAAYYSTYETNNMYTINFKFQQKGKEPITLNNIEAGDSILEIALKNDIDLHHNCGGVCACSTCHVAAGPKIAKLTGACNDCHARDDLHHGAFGPLCERCHVTRAFKEIRMPGGARRPDAVGRPR